MFESSCFLTNQNHLGKYVCLSVWAVSITFCFYYYALDVDKIKLIILGLLAVLGIATTPLFTPKNNHWSVVIQTLLMYASLLILLTIPAVGNHAILLVVITALNPVIFLNRMKVEFIFGNLIISLMILILQQMTKPISSTPIMEQLLDFFMKFIMLVFVFVQVYGLRLMYERAQSRNVD